MLKIIILATTVVHCLGVLTLREDGRPEVVVDQGTIVGVSDEYRNVNVLSFRGIPYAKPPLNQLRFMAPEKAGPWVGELDGSAQPTPCTQFFKMGSEDCLYLNVYAPEKALNGTEDPLAVMVYIHGGGFYMGSVEKYDKVYPLIERDVIVAVMQYRVGVLGFFSTGDDVAPGNQGLMDQTLAMMWVKDNIAAFGGDPERITLFGQSAGSASTHYQLLSPFSSGLYRNAILMSGNAFCPWSVGRDFYNTSRTIGERFNCSMQSSEELVACLQDVGYLLINGMYAKFLEWNAQPFKFAPRVDGTFIPDEPARLVKEGRFNMVPTIMGTTKDEGSLESGEMYAKPFIIESLMSDFTTNGPISLELYDDEDPVITATVAYQHYLGGINITEDNAQEFTKLLDHRLFHINLDWLVQEQSNQSEVYAYQFNHRGEWGLMDYYETIGLNISEADEWVAHADDLQYIFERESSGELSAENDLEISRIYTSLFTNFAKYGSPTPDESLLGFLWPQAAPSDLVHLSIDLPPTLEGDSRQEARQFWESLPLRINEILH